MGGAQIECVLGTLGLSQAQILSSLLPSTIERSREGGEEWPGLALGERNVGMVQYRQGGELLPEGRTESSVACGITEALQATTALKSVAST